MLVVGVVAVENEAFETTLILIHPLFNFFAVCIKLYLDARLIKKRPKLFDHCIAQTALIHWLWLWLAFKSPHQSIECRLLMSWQQVLMLQDSLSKRVLQRHLLIQSGFRNAV